MGVSLQPTVPKKERKKKVPPLKGVTTKVIFSRTPPKKVGLLQGGVVVGLLQGGCSSGTTTGGGVVVPPPTPQKVDLKLAKNAPVPLQRSYFGGFQAHSDSAKLFWGSPCRSRYRKKRKKVPPLEGVTTKVNFSRKKNQKKPKMWDYYRGV